MAISTNGVILTRLAGALYNQQLSNATYNEVLTAFNSPTALNTLANYLISTDFASKTDLQIATTLVTNLSLTAVTGLDNWIAAQLTAAGTNKGAKIISLLNDFSNISATDATYGAAVTAFNTKIDAAQLLSQTTGNTGTTFSAAGTTGTTFTLTTNIDAFTGTANPDTFSASLVYDSSEAVTSASTYTVTDTLVGGAGSDVFNITISGAQDAGVTIPPANVSGVETFNVRNTVAQTATLDATTASGLTSFVADRSTGAVAVTGLASTASGGVNGDGTVANGASSFGWGASVAAGTVNISGGTTAGAVTTSGTVLATNTINSTGASNTIGALTLGAAVTSLNINATSNLTTGAVTNSTAAAVTKITATGAGNINLSSTALESAVATIDASALTGTLTVALGSNVAQKVTGGAGNDVITTGAVLTTGSVDAGAGTGDVLVVGSNVSHVNTTSLAAKYTNFELIRVQGTLDMDLFPAMTGVQLSGSTNSITNLSATEAAAITARANIGNTTLTLKSSTGTADVLTITNGLGTTSSAATTIGALTATGFETINLVANPGPSATTGANRTSSITAITDSSLTAVNLTGTAWTLGDIASTKATTWTASALTGDGATTPVGLTLSATGSAAAGSVVTGSGLRDSVIMNSSTGVTFNLGAGNDIFSTTSTLLLPSGAATDNTINAEAGTADRLVITGAASLSDTSFTKTTGFEALELAGGAVDNSVTGMASGFLSAFATGVTVTDTAIQADAQTYTWSSGLYSQPVTITHATSAVGTSTAANQSITTGAGADTITLTAASFTGKTAAGGGSIVVATGAGADTITVSTGTLLTTASVQAVTITPGTGADIVVATTHVNGAATTGLIGNYSFVINAGDSTTTAYDQITGFRAGATTAGEVSDTLDFSNVNLAAYTAAAPTGYTAAQLTVAVSAAGAVTFAGTSAATLTLAEKIAAIQAIVTTTNGDSAFFTDSGNTYVFNNETTSDVVVQLTGLTGVTALITTNAATANAIFIG